MKAKSHELSTLLQTDIKILVTRLENLPDTYNQGQGIFYYTTDIPTIWSEDLNPQNSKIAELEEGSS